MFHRHFRSASINEEDVSENPFVDRNLVSSDGNHAGSLGLGLRAMDSSSHSQTRRQGQTFPFYPEISLNFPSLRDCLGTRANLLPRSYMLLPCHSCSWGICLGDRHRSSPLAANVPALKKTRLFQLPSGQADCYEEPSCLSIIELSI